LWSHWPNSSCHTYLKIFEKKGGQLEFEDAEKNIPDDGKILCLNFN
jgi:hypothetical protein